MVSTAAVFATVASLATLGVDAHGTLVKPGLTFTGTGYGGNFDADVSIATLKMTRGSTSLFCDSVGSVDPLQLP
ncbi:unnamed protein product [Phytophthora lilii]|uniref:Unnamed protein product n=1 Tax=Phytophthora lilii TaxID=2077276 RepID=A0A9W6TIG1_9STRA|nr:unnamed protein product [Phytophthora lilii]